jgi:hypothetical protein
MIGLSKSNYEKLDENLLYSTQPSDVADKYIYWCKNWTFKVHKLDSGIAYMIDTYYDSWDSHKIKVTDDNIDQFEVVFDFRDVRRIRDSEQAEYNEEDLYCAATDSGGYNCGGLYWVKRNAKKSKTKLIEKTGLEIESLRYKLSSLERELSELNSGIHWKLK